MARITDIFLIDTLEQNALIIRSNIAVKEIPIFINKSFAKLGEFITSNNNIVSDTPFLQICGSDPNSLEIMVGNTVPYHIDSFGDIQDFIIPAGKKIFCYYQGDNGLMEPIYEEMIHFAEEKGYTVKEGIFEYYLNSPDYGVDKLLTKVVMHLDDK